MQRIQIATLFTLIILLAGMNHNARAQSRHLTASNMALGGGGTAYLDTYHANFTNPANLMLNEGRKPRLGIGLFGGLGANVGGSIANISVYNEYFTQGLTITGDVADEMFGKWFGPGASSTRGIGMSLDIVPFGASYRSREWAASVAVRSRVLMNGTVNRGFAELALHGLDAEKFSTPTPVNMDMEFLGFYEVSVGYARTVQKMDSFFGLGRNVRIYAGIAPKLLLGAHTSRANFTSTLLMEGADQNDIDLIRHEFRYYIETTGSLSEQLDRFYTDRQNSDTTPDIGEYLDPDPSDAYTIGAIGLGFDLGATAEMDLNVPVIGAFFRGPEKLRLAFSLTDLGAVQFKDKVGRYSADGLLEWRGFELDQERIDNEFDGDQDAYLNYVLEDSIGAEIYGSYSPEEISSISRPLPSMANIGAHLIMRRLSVSLDIGKGFIERGTNSRRLSLATGIEYHLLGIMPFRVGMRTGGMTSMSYSAGLGLEFRNLEFSFGASAVRRSLNRGLNFGVAWSGLVLRF